jgi:Family of unknown function (DUF6459)
VTSALISDSDLSGGDLDSADSPREAGSARAHVAGAKKARRPYLAPVPDCEPPFDDERSAISRLQQLRPATRSGAALFPVPEHGRKPTEADGRARPDIIRDKAVPGWSQDADIGVRRTATALLPAAVRSGPVLARALVEVLSGQRPLPQLRVHCAPDVFAGLQSRPIVKGALGHLLSVRVCEPADGVAEVSVVFRRAERVRALAFRIQGVDGRWRVTALQTA